MSLKEFVLKINSDKQLLDGAEKALRTAQSNIVNLEPGNCDDPADLFGFTRDEIELGLKKGEAYGLLSALTELTLNISAGLGVPSELYENNIAASKIVDEALAKARESSPNLVASLGIQFDAETGLGKVFVTHPVVPQLSPETFNPSEAKIKRRLDRRGFLGGIENIESGQIHKRIIEAGLTHSEVKTEDSNTLLGMKERKVWVEFARK